MSGFDVARDLVEAAHSETRRRRVRRLEESGLLGGAFGDSGSSMAGSGFGGGQGQEAQAAAHQARVQKWRAMIPKMDAKVGDLSHNLLSLSKFFPDAAPGSPLYQAWDKFEDLWMQFEKKSAAAPAKPALGGAFA